MKNKRSAIWALAGCASAVLAGPVFADEDCFVPMGLWQPRAALEQLAKDNQWSLRRIKIDDGCYEIDGRDSQGRKIEVTLHPATLAVIEIDYEDDDEEEEDD